MHAYSSEITHGNPNQIRTWRPCAVVPLRPMLVILRVAASLPAKVSTEAERCCVPSMLAEMRAALQLAAETGRSRGAKN